MGIEHKTLQFEIKAVDEETGIFSGYAATFAKVPDSYGDIIDRGAFVKTLKEMGRRIKILWQHNVMEPIGKPSEMTEDDKGLLVKGKLSLGVQRAREVLSLMKDGVITEMSIGYDTVKQETIEGIRHLKELKLYDISPVTFAANPDAQIMAVKEGSEYKPYPNEHACRLRSPGDFQSDTFKRTQRRSDGKVYSIIMGRLKGEDTLTEQAYRYDKDIWSASEASSHCEDHDGSFEGAEKSEDKTGRVLSANSMGKVQAALDALQALLDSAEKEPEPGKAIDSDEEIKLDTILSGITSELEDFDVKKAEARIDALLRNRSSSRAVLDTHLRGSILEAAELEGILDNIGAEMEGFDIKQAEARLDQILEKITLEVK